MVTVQATVESDRHLFLAASLCLGLCCSDVMRFNAGPYPLHEAYR